MEALSLSFFHVFRSSFKRYICEKQSTGAAGVLPRRRRWVVISIPCKLFHQYSPQAIKLQIQTSNGLTVCFYESGTFENKNDTGYQRRRMLFIKTQKVSPGASTVEVFKKEAVQFIGKLHTDFGK